MSEPKSYKSVIKHYALKPHKFQKFYKHLPKLLEGFGFDIAIGYLFSRLEMAQNMIIYCGITKLHRCDKTIVDIAISQWRRTREGFIEKYKNIYGVGIPSVILNKIKIAEGIRDRILHGKSVKDSKKRQAIVDALDYSEALNEHVYSRAGFKPFGDLRGYKGRGRPLDRNTTRWVLKGMGFNV